MAKRVQIKVFSVQLNPDEAGMVTVIGEVSPLFGHTKTITGLIPMRDAKKVALRLSRGVQSVKVNLDSDHLLSVNDADYVEPASRFNFGLQIGGTIDADDDEELYDFHTDDAHWS